MERFRVTGVPEYLPSDLTRANMAIIKFFVSTKSMVILRFKATVRNNLKEI